MTLNQAADQLYNLSLGGYFNREKFTADGWRRHVNALMRHPETLKIKNTLVQEIALEDGHWLFTINYIPSSKGDVTANTAGLFLKRARKNSGSKTDWPDRYITTALFGGHFLMHA